MKQSDEIMQETDKTVKRYRLRVSDEGYPDTEYVEELEHVNGEWVKFKDVKVIIEQKKS